MLKFTIDKNNNNKRLDNLLAKKFNVSKTLIFKLLRKKKIKVNNQEVTNNYKTCINDIITIDYIFDEIPKNNKSSPSLNKSIDKIQLNIIYEDDNIILINKPIGILSQPNKPNDLSIQNLLLNYLIKTRQYDPKDTTFIPSICNRLDFNTSGIIIAAKNNDTLIEINNLIKNHSIEKYYQVMVFNQPPKNHDVLEAYHYKNDKDNLVYISDKPKPNYKKIITEYWVLKTKPKWSILEIKLITGKTHQIRAHLNHIGLNVVGDNKYKKRNDNYDSRIKTQALVSYKLIFHVTNPNSFLAYLNNKSFSLKDIWFYKFF